MTSTCIAVTCLQLDAYLLRPLFSVFDFISLKIKVLLASRLTCCFVESALTDSIPNSERDSEFTTPSSPASYMNDCVYVHYENKDSSI